MIKLRKENRKEQLRNAGMDTSKYFEFKVNQDIPKGSTLRVIVENNEREYDEIEQQIIDNGIIPVEGAFRRWIMAQYLKMTNYEGENNKNNGYHGYLNEQIDYNYTMKRLVAEAYEMSELERKFDYDELDKRKQFFSYERIVKIFEDYICKVNDIMAGDFCIVNKGSSSYYDNALTLKYYDICFDKHKYNSNEKCRNIFKTSGKNTFCYYITALDRIEGIVNTYEKLRDMYDKSYKYIYKVLKDFYLDYYIIIPEDLSAVREGKEKGIAKSKEWVEGYKRAGVYYTLQNMIENHGIKFTHDDYPYEDGMVLLNYLVFESQLETYKLHRMLQDILIENNFNLHESIIRNS